jgi:RecA-family ATPase
MRIVTATYTGRPAIDREVLTRLVVKCSHPDCVMLGLDPLVKLHDLNENDNAQMSFVMEVLEMLADDARVMLLLAHHTSKPSGSNSSHAGNVNSARGAGAIKDGARHAFTLSGPLDDDILKYGLSPTDRRRMLRLEDANKQNRSLGGDEPIWLEKVSVTLINGEEVGAFVPSSIDGKADGMRDHVGDMLWKFLKLEKQSASCTVPEAISAIQRGDELYDRMLPQQVKIRLERLTVRPFTFDDGSKITLNNVNGKRLLVLE